MKQLIQFYLETNLDGEITNTKEKILYEQATKTIKGETTIGSHVGYDCRIGNINNNQFYVMENIDGEDGFEVNLIIFSDEKEFVDKIKEYLSSESKEFLYESLSPYMDKKMLEKYI